MKLILTLILTLLFFVSNSQSVGNRMKTYSFGDSNNNMISELSIQAKCFLSNVFSENHVDTLSFYRVKYDEVFTKYASKDYLSTHSYTFIRWSKTGHYTNSNKIQRLNGNTPMLSNKIIILYSTDHEGLEDLTIYIMN